VLKENKIMASKSKVIDNSRQTRRQLVGLILILHKGDIQKMKSLSTSHSSSNKYSKLKTCRSMKPILQAAILIRVRRLQLVRWGLILLHLSKQPQ